MSARLLMNMNIATESQDADTDDSAPGSGADSDIPPERSEPPHAAVIAIEIGAACPRAQSLDVTWLRARLDSSIPHLTAPIRSATFAIVGDERMRLLHDRHLGINATTDVLTFDLASPGGPVEAEIVLCLDEAARRSDEFGHSLERELLLYALHGLLHCTGFDDATEADALAMHAEEDRILKVIGVGQTYRTDGGAPS